MDFKAEANKVLADVLSLHHGYCTGLAAGVLADALRRAYEAGAASSVAAKDAAYSERNQCVIGLGLLAKALGYRAGVALHPIEDTSWETDWRNILVIELPTGQLTWHFHDSEAPLLEQFPKLDNHVWDGHTTPEKYRRLLSYSPAPPATQEGA